MIVSGASSTDLHTIDGFTNWSISIGFGIEVSGSGSVNMAAYTILIEGVCSDSAATCTSVLS